MEDAGVNLGIVPISRRHMVTASVDTGKRSTADLITSAFLAQTGVEPEPMQGLAARSASRRGAEERRASAQAAHLGIGPAPTAESRADLAGGGPTASITKEALPQCASPAPVSPTDDSFEVSRAETVKRLVILQKSFKGSSGPSPAWAFTDAQKSSGAGKVIAHRLGSEDDCDSSKQSGGGAAAAGKSGSRGGGGGAEDGDGDLSGSEREKEEVVPVGEEFGAGPEATAAHMVCARAVEGAAMAGAGALNEMMRPRTATAAGLEGSRRGEGCATSPRDEEPGSCFRTVSVAQMQGTSKPVVAASATPARRESAGTAAAEAGGGDGVAGAITAATTDVQAETDELTSLPLPNLISPQTGATRPAKPPLRAGHRFSAAAYLQKAPLEPRLSATGGAATRNSDLGYYLEAARYTETAPPHGAQPVRHNLFDSPMVRERAAQAAKEAEVAAAARAPAVLDYVPSLKPHQGSRVNLLAQPSQKRMLLPGGGGGGGGGGAVLPLGEDDDDGDSGAAASRRLEYTPKWNISRKFSHANLHSGSILLCAGASSRPMSPVHSRPSLLAVADLFPSSPRVTGTDSGERCFHVTRAGAAAVTAAACGNAVPAAAATSGGLPSAHSVGVLPSAVSTSALPTAAASPLGPTRRREARRESSSASQIHFGPVAMLKAPATPLPLPLRSTPSREQSGRSQRAIIPTLEQRPSASSVLVVSPPTSRLHAHSSGGGAAACGRRSMVHEVLGSAAWTGPGAAADTPPLAGASSVSGVSRGPASLDASRNHGVESGAGGRAAAGPASPAGYGVGSASRAAGRAARLLESLQRMTTVAPEVAPVQ